MRYVILISSVVALSGCVIRTVNVHDGLDTIVLDAQTKQPLSAAFVYDQVTIKDGPEILARSDDSGRLRLEPETKIAISPMLGEALTFQALWVCKEGYKPVRVAARGGWNADYRPSEYHTPLSVELVKSTLPSTESCSKIDG